MKKCPVCGVEHADNVPVCSICGTPLTSGAVAEKPAGTPQPEPASPAPDLTGKDVRTAVSSVVSQAVAQAEGSKQEKPASSPQSEPAADAPAAATPEDDEPFDDDSPFVVNAMRPTAEQRARKEAAAASKTGKASKESRKPAARPRGGKKPSAGPSPKETAPKPAQAQPSTASGSSSARTESSKSSTGRFATGKTAAPRNTGRPAASRHQPPAVPVVDTSAVAAASAQKVQAAQQNAKARSAQKNPVPTDTGEFDWSERRHKRRQPKTTTPVIAAVCALLALLIIAMIVLIGRMITGDGNSNADDGTPGTGISDSTGDESTDEQDGTEDINTPTDTPDDTDDTDDTTGETDETETGDTDDGTDSADEDGDSAESEDGTGDDVADTSDGSEASEIDDTSSEQPALPSITEVNDTVYATASLRVRDYPSTEYGEVINSLSAGQAVTRTGRCSNGWSRVEIDGVTGYVSESYLSTTQPADSSTGDTDTTLDGITITAVDETVYATTGVNVRNYPSSTGTVINTLSQGQSVTRTGRCSNGWSRVEIGGVTGYVYSDYLSTSQSGSSDSGSSDSGSDSLDGITITEVSETVYATTGVNVRDYPGSSGTVINTLSQGQSVTRTGRCSNGWSRVEIGGVTGYVYSSYLSTSQSGSGSGSGSSTSSSYILPDSNSRYYSRSELASLSASELRLARNEIYARHGRLFNDSSLQEYFNNKTWYSGTVDAATFDANINSYLNEYELANLLLIIELENG